MSEINGNAADREKERDAGGGARSSKQADALAKLEKSIIRLVQENGGARADGAVASFGTVRTTINVTLETARRLHRLAYEIQDIHNLGERHIKALVEDWEKQGLAEKTMQNQLSRLRQVAAWIGKPTLIKKGHGVWAYLPGVAERKVRTIAAKSKSWSENGIDVVAKLKEADGMDTHLGMMLRMGLVFGLRRKEQLMGKPWAMDGGTELIINANIAKSGRDRSIDIHHWLQRVVLDYAKSICRKGEYMGWPGSSYEQNINKYKYLMRVKLGITKADSDCVGHGLRAEYVENEALLRGLIPPSLGGKAGQMSDEALLQIQLKISSNTGHNRVNVLGAYYSSFRVLPKGEGLGGKVGNIIVDAERVVVGAVYANPAPKKLQDGNYRRLSADELNRTGVTIVLEENGSETIEYGVAEFVSRQGDLAEKLESILRAMGLGAEGR